MDFDEWKDLIKSLTLQHDRKLVDKTKLKEYDAAVLQLNQTLDRIISERENFDNLPKSSKKDFADRALAAGRISDLWNQLANDVEVVVEAKSADRVLNRIVDSKENLGGARREAIRQKATYSNIKSQYDFLQKSTADQNKILEHLDRLEKEGDQGNNWRDPNSSGTTPPHISHNDDENSNMQDHGHDHHGTSGEHEDHAHGGEHGE